MSSRFITEFLNFISHNFVLLLSSKLDRDGEYGKGTELELIVIPEDLIGATHLDLASLIIDLLVTFLFRWERGFL